jgi:two-component system, NtrC family, response regulator AtoC
MTEDCILVIEDQEDLAAVYEIQLKSAGYKVRKAHSGEEGIAEFQANGADLILLDITLPEIHGTQVLRAIREADADVPVVIITGMTDDDTRKELEQLGVQGYLTKPPDFDEMLDVIEHTLKTPTEESEVVTLRLPVRVLTKLREIDSNLERAIQQLVEK